MLSSLTISVQIPFGFKPSNTENELTLSKFPVKQDALHPVELAPIYPDPLSTKQTSKVLGVGTFVLPAKKSSKIIVVPFGPINEISRSLCVAKDSQAL